MTRYSCPAQHRSTSPRTVRLFVNQLEDRSLPSASFVLDWNSLLLDVQRVRAQGNQQSARALAIMGAAVYDSVNAIDPTHAVYHVDARAFPGVSNSSADAAAAQAAHDVAYTLYTQQADRDRFDALLNIQLGEITDGTAEDNGRVLGQDVAAQMLAWRANDGSSAVVPYTIGSGPGVWQPTPPAFAQTPSTPQWRSVTPFALTSGDQFRPGPPPALTSADYTLAFEQVKALGGDGITTPSTRTSEQTEIALFWAGLGVTNAGVAIWNQIAQTVAVSHNLTLADNARLFAQMSVSAADAFIAGFDAKYEYNFWRPVTAIRAADTDGNPDTVPDSTWTPLITTPNHPSYGSNHSTQSRAAAEALAAFFGTDHVSFTATWAGVERSFNKFTDAAKEAGISRIYGGIHWSFDMAAGLQQGRKIGQYVADHFFQPLTDSGGGKPGGGPKGNGAVGPDRAVTLDGERGNLSVFIAPGAAPALSWNTPTADSAPAHGKVGPAIEAPAPAHGDSHDEFVLRTDDMAQSDPLADELSVGPWVSFKKCATRPVGSLCAAGTVLPPIESRTAARLRWRRDPRTENLTRKGEPMTLRLILVAPAIYSLDPRIRAAGRALVPPRLEPLDDRCLPSFSAP